MLVRAGTFCIQMIFSQERRTISNALGNILGRAVVAIPGGSKIIMRDWIEKIISTLIRRAGVFSRAAVLRQYAKPINGALSLGSRAALINEYRYTGLTTLNRFEMGDLSARTNAERWLRHSILWANKLDDYPGLAKAWLGLWKVYVIVGDQSKALVAWRRG